MDVCVGQMKTEERVQQPLVLNTNFPITPATPLTLSLQMAAPVAVSSALF